MKWRVFFLGLPAILLFFLPLQAEKDWREAAKNRLFKEELTLARTSSSYFIFDLPGRVILLKARGMTLREWKIEGLRCWGGPVPIKAVTFEKKSALFAPRRKKIEPGANQTGDAFKLDVLELKDMPSSFALGLSRGLSVYIGPKPHNFFSRFTSLVRSLRWYTWLPLKNLWYKAIKKPFIGLDVRVSSPDEAKALYWAIGEGFKGLACPY